MVGLPVDKTMVMPYTEVLEWLDVSLDYALNVKGWEKKE